MCVFQQFHTPECRNRQSGCHKPSIIKLLLYLYSTNPSKLCCIRYVCWTAHKCTCGVVLHDYWKSAKTQTQPKTHTNTNEDAMKYQRCAHNIILVLLNIFKTIFKYFEYIFLLVAVMWLQENMCVSNSFIHQKCRNRQWGYHKPFTFKY